jgi:glucose-6-phosphate isomerase
MVAAGLNPDKHMVAVTSETSPLAQSSEYLASFFMDDFIGGRYSSTSAVGGAILSLAFGPEVFELILAGAHEADLLARSPKIRENAALMDALIGVWERNFLSYPYTAILPYCQALLRFPAHLQQLDMESNGKSVNRNNERLTYSTGPVVFGEPGTNGQHSFYQLLHQGTDIVPLQFIGFRKAQTAFDIYVEGSTSEKKLNANLTAQIAAFALGRENKDNPNKNFEGERPSSLIYGDLLTPQSLGALLAHFENKVMFQGFAWNINSFDQEGVQLGKILTKEVLAGTADERLGAYAKLLGV